MGRPRRMRASVSDVYVKRYRPLVIVAGEGITSALAKGRATWEANTRLGKSAQANATVQGWRQTADGPLWEPNLRVMVRAPWLSLEGEMLVKGASFSKGSGGTTTGLELVSPQAFEPEPPDGKSRKAKGGDVAGELWVPGSGEAKRAPQV
jgi:prophage tail gpP-like protein